MSKTRTTVIIDDDLLKLAKSLLKLDSTTDVITSALSEVVRRGAFERLAKMLGTETGPVQDVPRRRPPEFVAADATDKKVSK